VELLGAPVAFHTFAPRWEPLIWNLADHAPEELLASANAWLQALAVMRSADAEAEAFAEVFTEAARGVAGLAPADPVRWAELMRLLLTWIYWRRPAAERARLEAAALAVQKDEAFQKEAQAMGSKLGPSLVEESFAKGQAQGQLETARSFLRDLVQNRFQVMPEDLDRRIAACADVERLRAAARQVLHVQQPQDISL